MFVYYFTIISVFFFAVLAQENRTKKYVYSGIFSEKNKISIFYMFIIAMILISVAGLRWNVGTDYGQYAINYNFYSHNFWNALIHFDEFGIYLIAKISSIIFDDYATMFFLCSFITIGLFVYNISKYSNMFVFSILLFIFLGIWHGTFNGIRQYLAIAIIFSGQKYILKKNFKKYLFVVIIAYFFHVSSIIALFFYFIPKKKLNQKQILTLICLIILVLFSYDTLLSIFQIIKKEQIRNIAYYTSNVSVPRVLTSIAPIILYLIFTNKNKLKKSDYFYINITIINAVINIATINSAMLARISYYSNVFLVLSYPRILNFGNQKLKLLFKTIIVYFYFAFWYIEVSGSKALSFFKWVFYR